MSLAPLPSFVHGRKELDGFTLYRTAEHAMDKTVGCVVLVTIDFENDAAARSWVDSVMAAMAVDPNRSPELISGNFHIRDDGRQVVNYGEWVSAEGHEKSLTAQGFGSDTDEWKRVREFPGLLGVSFSRHRP